MRRASSFQRRSDEEHTSTGGGGVDRDGGENGTNGGCREKE